MSTVRVVRPRPLGNTDRIPVFWAGQEPPPELKAIDGGALWRHLSASLLASAPAAAGGRKRKREAEQQQTYAAPLEGEAHDHFSPFRRPPQQPRRADPIHVPRVRQVADYRLNTAASARHGPALRGELSAAPYLRHKQLPPGMYDDAAASEYDADDEDAAWLLGANSHSTKNGQQGQPSQGLLAAAVGLYRSVSQRISGSGGGAPEPTSLARHVSSGAGSGAAAAEQRLPLDMFERSVEALELAHHGAVREWWEGEERAGRGGRLPRVPAMKQMLPRSAALDELERHVPDRKLAAALLDHWLKRRAAEGGPLLQRLWFEQPWKTIAFARHAGEDDDLDDLLPFTAEEPRSAPPGKGPRRGGARRRVTHDDALDVLIALRSELEVVRTLADQVRKREKLKRQLLMIWQQETVVRRRLGLPAAAPLPRPRPLPPQPQREQQQHSAAPDPPPGGARPGRTAAAGAAVVQQTAQAPLVLPAGRNTRTAAAATAAAADIAEGRLMPLKRSGSLPGGAAGRQRSAVPLQQPVAARAPGGASAPSSSGVGAAAARKRAASADAVAAAAVAGQATTAAVAPARGAGSSRRTAAEEQPPSKQRRRLEQKQLAADALVPEQLLLALPRSREARQLLADAVLLLPPRRQQQAQAVAQPLPPLQKQRQQQARLSPPAPVQTQTVQQARDPAARSRQGRVLPTLEQQHQKPRASLLSSPRRNDSWPEADDDAGGASTPDDSRDEDYSASEDEQQLPRPGGGALMRSSGGGGGSHKQHLRLGAAAAARALAGSSRGGGGSSSEPSDVSDSMLFEPPNARTQRRMQLLQEQQAIAARRRGGAGGARRAPVGRRNGLVRFGSLPGMLAVAASSSEAVEDEPRGGGRAGQQHRGAAVAYDSGSEDSGPPSNFRKGPRSPRKPARVPPPMPVARHGGGSGGGGPLERRVLGVDNHSPRGNARSGDKLGVAKSAGAGGRKPGGAAAAAAASASSRKQVASRELRALGLAAVGPPLTKRRR